MGDHAEKVDNLDYDLGDWLGRCRCWDLALEDRMRTFDDFMIVEAVGKDQTFAKLRTENRELMVALEQIANLWPMPPHCAEVNPDWVGEHDGKMRAILLEAALEISRNAVAKAKTKV